MRSNNVELAALELLAATGSLIETVQAIVATGEGETCLLSGVGLYLRDHPEKGGELLTALLSVELHERAAMSLASGLREFLEICDREPETLGQLGPQMAGILLVLCDKGMDGWQSFPTSSLGALADLDGSLVDMITEGLRRRLQSQPPVSVYAAKALQSMLIIAEKCEAELRQLAEQAECRRDAVTALQAAGLPVAEYAADEDPIVRLIVLWAGLESEEISVADLVGFTEQFCLIAEPRGERREAERKLYFSVKKGLSDRLLGAGPKQFHQVWLGLSEADRRQAMSLLVKSRSGGDFDVDELIPLFAEGGEMEVIASEFASRLESEQRKTLAALVVEQSWASRVSYITASLPWDTLLDLLGSTGLSQIWVGVTACREKCEQENPPSGLVEIAQRQLVAELPLKHRAGMGMLLLHPQVRDSGSLQAILRTFADALADPETKDWAERVIGFVLGWK